jgi:hypothetical protein
MNSVGSNNNIGLYDFPAAQSHCPCLRIASHNFTTQKEFRGRAVAFIGCQALEFVVKVASVAA